MKIDNFQGDLTNISAKKEALVVNNTNSKQNIFETLILKLYYVHNDNKTG